MNINSPLSHRNIEPESGVLYVVGTPIGNLSDISFRCLKILKNVDLIACEDTRHTKKLLTNYKFNNNLISFHKNNCTMKIPKLITELESGKSIALVSDAGLPGISDPGEDLINEIRLKGLEVICVPGPCAALTALVASGLPSSKFVFEGFLPIKKIEREKILNEISIREKTTIIYESPHRLQRLLEELEIFCGSDRQIHITKELTKRYETHLRMRIGSSVEYFKDKKIIGEFTIVIQGLNKQKFNTPDHITLKKDLVNLIKAGLSLSSAAKYLSKKENLSKNLIYNLNKDIDLN